MNICKELIEDSENPQGCIVVLPGRGGSARTLGEEYAKSIKGMVIIGLSNDEKQWYPLPNGPNDQVDAVNGIETARRAIRGEIAWIKNRYNLPTRKIALVGFSAGAVMALEISMHHKEPFALTVCHSGAILEPKNTPKCHHLQSPVVLTHNKDDDCFSWEERYLPMKNSLLTGRYNLIMSEHEYGGHSINHEDIQFAINEIKKIFDVNNSNIEKKYANLVRELNLFKIDLETERDQMEQVVRMLEDRGLDGPHYQSLATTTKHLEYIRRLIRESI